MKRVAKSVFGRMRMLFSAGRILRARLTGVELGPDCELGAGSDILLGYSCDRQGRVSVGGKCTLETGVIIRPYAGSVILGENVYLGPGTVIYGHGGVTIGDSTLVSMHCRILSSNHTLAAQGVLIRSQPDIPRPTTIGRDVWLGAGVTVLGGVKIGDGAVVGAGAVVTKDIPAYAIATGVPARVTAHRS